MSRRFFLRIGIQAKFKEIKSILRLQDASFSNDRMAEIGWLVGGQIITLLLGIVSIKLTTSIGPEEFGFYTLTLSISGLLSLAFFGPLEQGFVRFFFDYAQESKRRSMFATSLLCVLRNSSLVLIVLCIISGAVLSAYFQFELLFVVAAALMIIGSLLSAPLNGMLNAMRLRKEVAIIQVAERVLVIMFLFFFVIRAYPNATMVMFAIAAGTSVSLLARLLIFRRHSHLGATRRFIDADELRTTKREIYKSVSVYSFPFLLWGAISWLQSNGERWVINGMLTNADVGRYGLAATLVANSAVLMFNVLTQFITPIIFSSFTNPTDARNNRGSALIRLYVLGTITIFACIAIVFLVFGELITKLVSTRAFVVDGVLLCLLTVGAGLFYLGQTMTTVGMVLKRPQAYITAKMVTAVLSVGFYIAGCYWGGISGVAWAIVLINAVYFFMITLTNRWLMRHTLPAQGI